MGSVPRRLISPLVSGEEEAETWILRSWASCVSGGGEVVVVREAALQSCRWGRVVRGRLDGNKPLQTEAAAYVALGELQECRDLAKDERG